MSSLQCIHYKRAKKYFPECFNTIALASNCFAAPSATQYASKFGKLSSRHRTGKSWFSFQSQERQCQSARSQCEEIRLWQRSWGRRLGIRKDGIEPQDSPWKFSSIYPQNQSLPTLLLCALTYTSDFMEGCPPPPSLWKRVNLQLQLIKFLGVTRVFQPTNSSEGSLACLTGLSGHMWLLTVRAQPWEARDALNFLKTDSFKKLKIISIVLVG